VKVGAAGALVGQSSSIIFSESSQLDKPQSTPKGLPGLWHLYHNATWWNQILALGAQQQTPTLLRGRVFCTRYCVWALLLRQRFYSSSTSVGGIPHTAAMTADWESRKWNVRLAQVQLAFKGHFATPSSTPSKSTSLVKVDSKISNNLYEASILYHQHVSSTVSPAWQYLSTTTTLSPSFHSGEYESVHILHGVNRNSKQ